MKRVIILATLATLICCGRGGKAVNETAEAAPKNFELPSVPALYTTQQQRAEYIAAHYWDKFDFADTSYINLPDVTEQAFADYIYFLNNVPSDISSPSVKKVLKKSEVSKEMSDYFNELFERYLYEPNSPMRNEDLYIVVLEYIVNSDYYEDIEKLRPRAQLEMALKNRVGDKAADIRFTLSSGQKMNLYDVKADYTLLFINNPDCHSCAELTKGLQASAILGPLIDSGKLKIVMVYPDEDLEAWHKHKSDIPSGWINGYDAELAMRGDKLYDLRAIPTLYLLDRDKTVLLKDVAELYPLEYYFAQREQ